MMAKNYRYFRLLVWVRAASASAMLLSQTMATGFADSASSKPQNTSSTDVTYRIPPGYLGSNTTAVEIYGDQAFTLTLLLPDMRPAGEDMAEFKKVGWVRQMTALVEPHRQFKNLNALMETSVSVGHTDMTKFRLDHGCKTYDSPNPLGSRLVTCDTAEGLLEVQCNYRNKFYPYPACTVFINNQDDRIIYNYSADFEDMASTIDNKLRMLIDQFRLSKRG